VPGLNTAHGRSGQWLIAALLSFPDRDFADAQRGGETSLRHLPDFIPFLPHE
jgi:hypothetical protein